MSSSEISSDSLIQSSAENPASEESSAQASPNPPVRVSPENGAKKPSTSERRMEANRKNALRSTGPKTVRGKDNAARNSLKHGLLAKSVVIMDGAAKENKAEFNKLLNGLCHYFNPEGTAEELLVEEIAVCYWMERRAQIYENIEIRRQASDLAEYEASRERESGKEDLSRAPLLLDHMKAEAVQRYTANHQKRRYRALAQLERLQRQRSGETIPAPVICC
jgi:hypothetical protein